MNLRLCFMLFFVSMFAFSCEKKPEDKVYAIVNGEFIKGKDVFPKLGREYSQTQDAALKKSLIHIALDELANEKIVKKEAKKIGLEQTQIYDFFENAQKNNLMSSEQLSLAKSKYLSELRARSKIIIFDSPK